MTLYVFQQTFGINTHFLQYLELLNAIPTSWRKKVNNSYEENEINVCENKIIDTKNISNKTLRQILTKKDFWEVHHMQFFLSIKFHILELIFMSFLSD